MVAPHLMQESQVIATAEKSDQKSDRVRLHRLRALILRVLDLLDAIITPASEMERRPSRGAARRVYTYVRASPGRKVTRR